MGFCMWVRGVVATYIIVTSFFVIFSPANHMDPDALFRLGQGSIGQDLKLEHLGPTFSVVLKLTSGTEVSLRIPEKFLQLTNDLENELNTSHAALESIVGKAGVDNLTIELLSNYNFYVQRKHPTWVNAVFSNNKILIPVSMSDDNSEIIASLRHEYTHAVIKAAGAGKCPVWMDEGLAQLLEIEHSPELVEDMQLTIYNSEPLSLLNLEKSFIQLPTDVLPAAYAESFLAVNILLEYSTKEQVQDYFSNLRSGLTHERAFQQAFDVSIFHFNRFIREQHQNLLT